MPLRTYLESFFARLSQTTYYYLLLFALLLPNLVLSVVMQQPMIGRVLNILVMLPIYMLVLLIAKRPGRVYWGLLVLILLHAFQLVLLTIFSGSVVAVDMLLNLFTSEPDEAGELLSNILLPILSIGGFYLVSLIVATASAVTQGSLLRSWRIRMGKIACGILLLALPIYIGAKQRFPYLHLRAEVYPMSVFYNMYLATKKLREVLRYDQTSAEFCFGATSERDEDQPEVYVLVLGETSRAHSWSLFGYPRPTTPHLERLPKEELVAFRDVMTQSNTTYKSIPIILSPADAEHAEELPRVQGLLAAFREAGFYTVFVSNQPANRSYIDYFAQQGDEHHAIRKELRHPKRRIYDADMLPYLKRALEAKHKKLLVVLHTYGSHFSYRDRCPQAEQTFPVPKSYSGSAKDSLALRNAYDNAIIATDRFLASVIELLRAQACPASMLYISDHGEDVYDDARERFLHSSPDISYYQLHVPMLLWMSPAYREAYPQLVATAQANQRRPISTNAVFPTMLELAGIQTRYRRDSLSVVSSSLRTGTRYYLNDRYACVPLEALDLAEEDVCLFRKKGLQLPLPSCP